MVKEINCDNYAIKYLLSHRINNSIEHFLVMVVCVCVSEYVCSEIKMIELKCETVAPWFNCQSRRYATTNLALNQKIIQLRFGFESIEMVAKWFAWCERLRFVWFGLILLDGSKYYSFVWNYCNKNTYILLPWEGMWEQKERKKKFKPIRIIRREERRRQWQWWEKIENWRDTKKKKKKNSLRTKRAKKRIQFRSD